MHDVRILNASINEGFSFCVRCILSCQMMQMLQVWFCFCPWNGTHIIFLWVYLFPFWTVFCCSSKPTGGAGGSFGQENAVKSGHNNRKSITVPSDWMCISCEYVNFARRTSCFQVCVCFFFRYKVLISFCLDIFWRINPPSCNSKVLNAYQQCCLFWEEQLHLCAWKYSIIWLKVVLSKTFCAFVVEFQFCYV